MTGAQIITQTMEQFPESELIFASKLYTEQLSEAVSEEAYYQTLGRMCKAGSLCRIAKGTYYRPKTSKYGIVPPSQKVFKTKTQAVINTADNVHPSKTVPHFHNRIFLV